MPVVGERKKFQGYVDQSLKRFAGAFNDVTKQIRTEGVDLMIQPMLSMMNESVDTAMKDFFVENSAYTDDMTPEELDDHINMMNEQYENDKQSVLEYANIGGYNPVIGLSFPMHKLLLI